MAPDTEALREMQGTKLKVLSLEEWINEVKLLPQVKETTNWKPEQ